MDLGQLNHVLPLQTHEEIECYIHEIRSVWTLVSVFAGRLDGPMVSQLQSLYPLGSSAHRARIRDWADSIPCNPECRAEFLKQIFGKGKVVSIKTFFQDTKLLDTCHHALRAILTSDTSRAKRFTPKIAISLQKRYFAIQSHGDDESFYARWCELLLSCVRYIGFYTRGGMNLHVGKIVWHARQLGFAVHGKDSSDQSITLPEVQHDVASSCRLLEDSAQRKVCKTWRSKNNPTTDKTGSQEMAEPEDLLLNCYKQGNQRAWTHRLHLALLNANLQGSAADFDAIDEGGETYITFEGVLAATMSAFLDRGRFEKSFCHSSTLYSGVDHRQLLDSSQKAAVDTAFATLEQKFRARLADAVRRSEQYETNDLLRKMIWECDDNELLSYKRGADSSGVETEGMQYSPVNHLDMASIYSQSDTLVGSDEASHESSSSRKPDASGEIVARLRDEESRLLRSIEALQHRELKLHASNDDMKDRIDERAKQRDALTNDVHRVYASLQPVKDILEATFRDWNASEGNRESVASVLATLEALLPTLFLSLQQVPASTSQGGFLSQLRSSSSAAVMRPDIDTSRTEKTSKQQHKRSMSTLFLPARKYQKT
ncbi:hypothetical protein ANO11243_097240 [Dothideomycetidae sp. 11243]|nr:hypothetical protein ANO11243_097240 [fungal sp. No.11243]